MDIHRNPELLDKLALAYALGTLRGGARRRLETLARERSTVRAAILIWQGRVAGLTELEKPVAPAPHVWVRIQNLVQAERERARRQAQREPVVPAGGWWRSLALWRGAALAGAMATVIAVLVGAGLRERLDARIVQLQAQLSAQPQIEYVAVLNDDQAGAAMLVTFDPRNRRLTLQRVGGYAEAADKSLQLWALPPGARPRSLGVLSQERQLQLVAGEGDVSDAPVMAISLEPRGGVPGETGPTGPVLFKGTVIRKTL